MRRPIILGIVLLALLLAGAGCHKQAKDAEKVSTKRALVALSAVHAAPVFSNPVEMAAPSAKAPTVREMSRPKPYMKWIVPAGAIAALWIAVAYFSVRAIGELLTRRYPEVIPRYFSI